jgi:hypothetical protein
VSALERAGRVLGYALGLGLVGLVLVLLLLVLVRACWWLIQGLPIT